MRRPRFHGHRSKDYGSGRPGDNCASIVPGKSRNRELLCKPGPILASLHGSDLLRG